MKYNDHEFAPVTDEERAAREREEELARRIRREVLRVQSGEADEEIRADREREQAEEEARQEEQRKEERRRSNIFWLLFSGNILVRKGASEYYRYMICIAAMFFVSIFVMFTALHLDMKYSRLYREVQMLRERSTRLQEQRFRHTTHSAILFSGNILVRKGASEYYRYMICIAAMFFVSIFVMFTALHLDMKYSRLYREVQMLRERSTRLQEQRFRHTTHSAILEELRRRGIDLYDPVVPGEILDD